MQFELGLILLFLAVLLVLGILEKRNNDKNVEKLKVRINVNGIRGKSTITRMTTAVLKEAGYNVIGKTTGTAARTIYWNTEEEEEINRGARGANIVEQIHVIKKAADMGADALVCECMAVDPKLQVVYQHQIIHANITLIVNVLEDHLDVMGPTTKQIAYAFSRTIPRNGTVIIQNSEFNDFFKQEAEKVNAKVVIADESQIPEGFLDKFPYLVFPNNVAMPLAVASVLGIDKEVALRGLLKAHPDPGAMMVHDVHFEGRHATLVNAFAANEPSSTYEIWQKLVETGKYRTDDPIVLMNARPDRVDRTRQFANDFLHRIPNATVLAVGENTYPIAAAHKGGKLPNVTEFYNLDRRDADGVFEVLKEIMQDRVILCVGNIHGLGEVLLDRLLENDGEADITAEPTVE
ncbi:MAG: poly-gamma-glutamate synthase PgsB [Clostridia bacterium]|nr:poly-gamma-glutamate synthase PgsB [Clostridia bacterium]